MRIEFSRSALNTDAFALIAEGWNDAVQEGNTPDRDGVCPVTAKTAVLYAVSDDDDIVGVLCFDQDVQIGLASIKLLYVEPSMRKRGVCRQLIEALKDHMKVLEITSVTAAVTPENKAGMAALAKLSGRLTQLLYGIRV